MRHSGGNLDSYPDCMLCCDTALMFGDAERAYEWCTCPIGVRRRESEPGLCDEANATREKVLRIGVKV